MIKNIFRKGREQEEESNHPVSGEAKGRILVVDDSPTEVVVFKKILTKQGYQILVASDGQEGVEMAKKELPDLILMDVVMPVLNGFQATRQLKNDDSTANIPVIMVTTKDQQTDINWGMRQGADEYMVKPVSPAELLNKIKALINA
ncbi:MAG: response regulator [Candidatus Thiodiazotropha lotti]|uniref:Response regulator n=1 Tax=Candidatus Thiodiazotropha lotti TaxID=2792787 RepID=A0A9E4K8Q6_9GAMM|nr:response regulator [Candidatus Thiodiazotropha lotti]MCG7922750.1 response regulator [Candidatus Thiodiazotropha lotti]MCG7928674.1 response regulator [Candidatus Thiodiazotropha lotti]MCG7941274.1 response regulator [Candidatus Thiodiazotropha lotti]MCG7982073.1 response regulator [Candidatus Thiodiazotropha lotti]